MRYKTILVVISGLLLTTWSFAGERFDTDLKKLRDQINATEVSPEVKTYTLGFVDFAEAVICVPEQPTFVSMKQLEIVKCIVQKFFPLTEKAPLLDTINSLAEKLQADPKPADRPTIRESEPVDPPPEKCNIEIALLNTDTDVFQVIEDNRIGIKGSFKELFFKAEVTNGGPGTLLWLEEYYSQEAEMLSDDGDGRVQERIEFSRGSARGTVTDGVAGLRLQERRAADLQDGSQPDVRVTIIARFIPEDRRIAPCDDRIKILWKR